MEFFGNHQKQEYRKSLLFEIIFQARFPDNLRIPNETPLDFQSNMRDQGYPNFNVNLAPIQDIFKPDLGGIPELLNTYIFSSADRNRPYQISLSKDSISLTHFGSYNKGDDFKIRLIKILESFVNIYGFSSFGRLGLRHRNMINEKNIPDITSGKIKSLIPESIFPELKQSNADEIKSIHKRYTLDDGKISINASYALETVSGIYGQILLNNQISYFIDIDCFTDLSIEKIQDVSEFYGLFIQKTTGMRSSGASQTTSKNVSSDHRNTFSDIVVNTDEDIFLKFLARSTNIAFLFGHNNVGSFRKLVIFNPDRLIIDINENDIGSTYINVTSRYTHPQWDIISEDIKGDINSIDSDFKIYSKNTVTVNPVRSSIHRIISDQIDELLNKDYDWDSIGYEEPSERDLNYAKDSMSDFITTISLKGYTLPLPYISNGEDGGATMKWSVGERILYFDIKYKSKTFTKVWNQNQETLVETYKLHKNLYTEIWEWLNNG